MPSPNASDPLRTTDHVPEPPPEVVTTDDLPVGEPTVTYHPPSAAPETPIHEAVPVVPGYEVEGVLGRGGMGVVWKARHVALKRTVALKMILLSGNAGPRELARFRAEAEAVARLQHPNIVQVFEVGQAEGHPYCALEFVEGGSLAAKLNGKPLPPREAAKLVESLARAMQLAHSRNVVHRDLKPANVLLAADGTPKVTDFGLARQLDEDSGVTQAGAVMGTPSYMAPEQASGRAHEAGPAADTYALGAILYECLSGRPPFRGETVMATLDQVRTQEPAPPSRWQAKVPLDVETICLRCLRKEPEARYASAAELADDLGRYLRGEPIRARPVGTAERVVKWVKRRPAIAAMIALVLLVTMGGLAGITWAYRKAIVAEGEARTQEAIAVGQRDTAVTEKKRADDRAEETRRQLAFSKVALADAAWREGQAVVANEHLTSVPMDLRNWEWRYLKRTSEGSLFTLRGHNSGVRAVAFSPDGERLVSCSDYAVIVWNARTGQELFALRGHTGFVSSLAFSPDGQRLVTAGGTVKVWDALTGRELFGLRGDASYVNSVAFSPNGRVLATGSGEPSKPGETKVWDAWTGQELFALKRQTLAVTSVAFSPDGLRLATKTEGFDGDWKGINGEVKVWDAHGGQELLTLSVLASGVSSLAFSPDSQRLMTIGGISVKVWDARTGQELLTRDGGFDIVSGAAFSPDGLRLVTWGGSARTPQVRVWDTRSGQELLTLKGHTASVSSVAFSPDGQRLATGSYDRTVKVWDTRTGQEPIALQGHMRAVRGLAFSPDGQRLVTGSGDKTAKVWDARTGQELLTLKRQDDFVFSVAFSPDGKRLVTGSGAGVKPGEAKVWDARTGQELLTLKGHTSAIHSVAFSPNGERLASASSDKTVKVWDARSGQELLVFEGHTGPVLSVAFSPNDQCIASASLDTTAKVWDAQTGQQVLTLKGHTSVVSSVAFSPDGQRLATGSWDGTAKLWDARTGQELLRLNGHSHYVTTVAFSPDDQRLATGSRDNMTKVWDARTGQEVLTLKGHGGTVDSVAFSPDGSRLATGGSGLDKLGEAKLWDARTSQELLTLERHGNNVQCVTFSPDGQHVVTGSADHTAKLWNSQTGQELLTLKGHTGYVTKLAISRDGLRLATASDDTTTKVWDVRTGQQLLDLQGHVGPVWSVAFSPDGQQLATASGTYDAQQKRFGSSEVKLWDAWTGQELRTLKGHIFPVSSVAFSPDGLRLVSTDSAAKTLIWDVTTGQPLPDAPTETVAGSARSPDGQLFAHIDHSVVRLFRPPDAEELLIRQARTAFDPAWHSAEARRHEQAGQWFAATFHVNQLLQHQADVPDLPEVLLRLHAREARWPEVLADLDRILARAPERVDARHWQALVLLTADRLEEYRRLCTAQVQRHHPARTVLALWSLPAAFTVPHGLATVAAIRLSHQTPSLSADRLRVVRTAVLAPDALARPAHLLELTAGAAPWLRGAALLRAGRPAEAVPLLTTNAWAGSQFFLALAEHARGRPTQAMQAASRALRWLDAPSKEDPKRTNGEAQSWDQRLEVDLLRREVEAKLGPIRVTPTTPPPMEPVR